ncbi:uncharacterized protein LOC129606433 [Condylostylus longicornis]|uniref:uncharacterized protein LOC129606433 n=1 Tax=Condylostylus longicornis TaxID=2530218 RepID=UPI00244DB157|nr:uncharacterized protein LOC129606433 [Condylostylus longicornis]
MFKGRVLIVLIPVILAICHQSEAQSTIEKANIECLKKFPLTPNENADIDKEKFEQISKNGKCFIDCVAKEMKFVENGAVNQPNIINFYKAIQPKTSPDLITSSVTNCATTSFTGSNDCDKSFNVYKCIALAL